MFIFPISVDGETTIPVAFLANILNESLGLDKVVLIVVIIINISALLTLIFSWVYRPKNAFLANLFTVNPVWFILRIVGAVFSIMAIMTIGPKAINSDVTGGMLLNDLLPTLFAVFLFAGILLPLLLNYGLLRLDEHTSVIQSRFVL